MKKKRILIIVGSIIAVILAMVIVIIAITNNKKTITYNVSFETNGGTLVDNQTVSKGKKVKQPEDPTKEGYMFIEWTYQGKTYDFSLDVTSDLVLTAEWYQQKENIETVLVKFDSDGGSTVPNQIIEKGNKVEEPIAPTKEGYIFNGWSLNDEAYDFNAIVEEDLELKAKWEKEKETNNTNSNNNNAESAEKKYTVTFNSNGGSSVVSQTITEGNKATKPSNPTKTNYLFTGWTLNGNEYNFDSAVITNITLNASWLLYGDVNVDGIINSTDITLIRRYISGTENFTENQKLVADVNIDNVIDDVDVEIIRKYITGGYGIDKLPYDSGSKYTINYNLNGGVLKDYNIKTYAAISLPFTLSNPTRDGYAFIGWTGSNGNTPQITLTISEGTTGNLEYNANWLLYGDIDVDGIINSTDITLIRKYISGTENFTENQKLVADVNLDGVVNDTDVEIIRQYITGGYGIDKLPHTS